jgi:hypothetical protein
MPDASERALFEVVETSLELCLVSVSCQAKRKIV